MTTHEYTLLAPFCGLGAGALGFQRAATKLMGHEARFRVLGGIDNDPMACADFEYLTGAPALCADIAKLTPAELRAFAGDVPPDVVFTSAPCLPGRETVITPEGLRPIESMRAGDIVLTHRGRYRRVAKVGAHPHDGDIFGVRLHGTVDVREFTGEHPLWVRRAYRPVVGGKQVRGRMRPPRFIEAKDVRVGDRIGFPVERQTDGCARAFVESFGDPCVFERGGHSTGRYAKPRHRVESRDHIRDLRPFATSAKLWWLFGAYLGDGYRVHTGGKYEVAFCVGAGDGPLARRVRMSLNEIGLGWNDDASGGPTNVKVRVASKHLYMLCGAFGDGAEAKDVPHAVMSLERPYLDCLIEGLRDTDGSERPARVAGGKKYAATWKVVSVSLPLLRSLQRLLLRRREFGAIHIAWPGGPQTIMGRKVQTRPRWEIKVTEPGRRGVHEFDEHGVWVRIRSIARRHAEHERVWNLEVDDDDTFCVPMMATHNCKGSSGLLPQAKADLPEYQALNRLALDWLELMVSTWDIPPALLLFENVPRIQKRATGMLKDIRGILKRAGYLMHEGYHECAELGGLAQKRQRYLLVARQPKRCPPLLYQPPKKRIRACGEVLGPLPMPNDPAGGPLHVLPGIGWLNWVRLAMIPAGGDHRDLPGVLAEGQERRAVFKRHAVERWDAPTGTIGGPGSNGVENVADPRAGDWYRNTLGVVDWKEPAGTVTAAAAPSRGAFSVADPRVACEPRAGAYGVADWKDPSKTVTGSMRVDNSEAAVADPRFNGSLGVRAWDEPASTVTGESYPSNGANAVADPRMRDTGWAAGQGDGAYGVRRWDGPTGAVTAGTQPGQGAFSVADPRINPTAGAGGPNAHRNKHRVEDWAEPAHTVIGATRPGSGAQSVADPRPRDWFANVLRVVSWTSPTGTVTTGNGPTNGGGCVADPRIEVSDRWSRSPIYGVLPWAKPSPTVAGGSHIGQGVYSVSDPRVQGTKAPTPYMPAFITIDDAEMTLTGEHRMPLAFVDDEGHTCLALEAFEKVNAKGEKTVEVRAIGSKGTRLPVVPVILSRDGTWHRPMTTLELAVLQGLPTHVNGAPLTLAGESVSDWRERIGNAVPVGAAEAIAEQMLVTLLSGTIGSFQLSSAGGAWVEPAEAATLQ